MLNNECYTESARKIAESFSDEVWDGSIPVLLGEVSRSLGVQKHESDLRGIGGVMSKGLGSHPIIVLDNTMHLARRRVHWAYLLGQVVWHNIAETESYDVISKDLSETSPMGKFAMAFASELLVPSEELKALQESDGSKSTAKVAQIFEVTLSVIRRHPERVEPNF